MTDVNIAVELLHDAHTDLFDTAILVSGDSDLTSAITALRERYEKACPRGVPTRQTIERPAGGGSRFCHHRPRQGAGQSVPGPDRDSARSPDATYGVGLAKKSRPPTSARGRLPETASAAGLVAKE